MGNAFKEMINEIVEYRELLRAPARPEIAAPLERVRAAIVHRENPYLRVTAGNGDTATAAGQLGTNAIE